MPITRRVLRCTSFVAALLAAAMSSNEASAQVVIGGPNGVVIGGGQGVRIGGHSGAQFGGGEGAKFGGPSGVQFGGGRGAKFGGPDGVQFGGGAGAKFGPVQVGGQPVADPNRPAADRSRPVAGGPVTDGTAPPVVLPRPTTLHYPESAKKPLDFELNGHPFTAKPGDRINLRGDRRWIIGFERGDGHGERRYSLPPGDYTFKPSRTGWNLFRNKPTRPAPQPEELPPPEDVRRRDARPSR